VAGVCSGGGLAFKRRYEDRLYDANTPYNHYIPKIVGQRVQLIRDHMAHKKTRSAIADLVLN
jgi:hypothetical protein